MYGLRRSVYRLAMCVLLTVGFSAPAAAQTDATAVARELFTQARSLMEAGEYAAACKKFAESQRLDPGGGTLLNLAVCHEKLGKTASAWAEFNQAIVIARRDGRVDREELARERIAALTPRLSRLVVEVPPNARAPRLELELNGVVLGEAAWGEALPVDPGEQVVIARAPGKRERRFSATINGDGVRAELRILPLADAPKPATRVADPTHHPLPAAPSEPEQRTLWPYWTATAVFGATAGVLTARAYASHQDVEEQRGRFGLMESEYTKARESAQRDALFADIAWGVTALSGGLALYMTFTAPKARESRPVAIGVSRDRVFVRGDF